MSIGASPSLKTIADLIGDIAPHSMSEMYGIIFADGSSSPASGTISLSSFRNKNFDTTAPVITLANGDEGTTNYTVERGTTYVDPGATADGGETVTVNTSQLNMAVPGTYTVTYSATDLAGNTGTTSRTVIVEDNAPPVITLSGDNPYTVGKDTSYVDPGATAYGGETVTVNTSCLNMAVPGTYTVTYSATNLGGNTGTASRTVIVERTEQVKLLASDAAAGDQFGQAVAVSGDYAIVGAYGDDGQAGSAYIFRRTGTNTWDAGTKIIASDKRSGDYFGQGVAISGDYAIVGAAIKDSYTGGAYIFSRTGTNAWDAGTKIVASDAAADDEFGASVAIDGDYAVVGGVRERFLCRFCLYFP